MRLMAVKSKQCASKKNKYYCPEVFLDVVADKLTSTAVLFLNVELLSEFYYNVSHLLSHGRKGLTRFSSPASLTLGSDDVSLTPTLSDSQEKIQRCGDTWTSSVVRRC